MLPCSSAGILGTKWFLGFVPAVEGGKMETSAQNWVRRVLREKGEEREARTVRVAWIIVRLRCRRRWCDRRGVGGSEG